ncbi:DNA alkylation repair protein [bacterium]|nr:DNA alkylation repair protein [bacterium]
MNAQDILAELQEQGLEKTRLMYGRHGAQKLVFGASYSAMNTLAKVAKKQGEAAHGIAQELWDSGYMETRVVACQSADPARSDKELLGAWAAGLSSHMDADNLAALAALSSDGAKMAALWVKEKDEHVLRAGLTSYSLLLKNEKKVTKAALAKLLARIEKEIHGHSDFVKEAMNYLLIAIGTYSSELREEAIAAAKRIGMVNIDHGETNCKTPDAETYIRRSVAHLERQD